MSLTAGRSCLRFVGTASFDPIPPSPSSDTRPRSTWASSAATSIGWRPRNWTHVPGTRARPARGMIDTSVVIDLEKLNTQDLPVEVAISSLTLAELAAGPHATDDPEERARRQDRARRKAAFDPLPFDAEAARSYGRIYAAVTAAGREARGPRAVDLLTAASAHASSLPLYNTRNPDDFRGLGKLLKIVTI